MFISRHFRSILHRAQVPLKVSIRKQSTFLAKINEERLVRYCPGGYHPVRIGDSFKDGTYKIVNKLGYSQYSTVWLAKDTRKNCHVALKIITADAFDGQKPTFELDILQQLSTRHNSHPGSKHILGLIDQFKHHGPNGEHVCLVFKAMGPDLAKYRKLFANVKIPVPIMKKITRQLLLALSFLHDYNQVIHTDIKPQNVLIETTEIDQLFEQGPSELFAPDSIPEPPNDFYLKSEQISSAEEDLTVITDLSVRLTDFGTSSWFDKHLTEWIQPPMLRAPEVILGASWDYRVDIWNLGALIWELIESKVLFDGAATPGAPYTPEAHLAQMMAVLGEMPKTLLVKGNKTSRYYDEEGRLLLPSPFPSCTLEGFSDYPESQDKKDYLEFLRSMLRLAPEERLDATRLLEAQWLRE